MPIEPTNLPSDEKTDPSGHPRPTSVAPRPQGADASPSGSPPDILAEIGVLRRKLAALSAQVERLENE